MYDKRRMYVSPDQDHVLSLADLEAGANTTFTDCAQHKYYWLRVLGENFEGKPFS